MNVVDALTDAASGAAAGAVAGPLGAAVSGIGGVVMDIAPDMRQWLSGSNGAKIAALVAQAVETVTGTGDAEAARQVLERIPKRSGNCRLN